MLNLKIYIIKMYKKECWLNKETSSSTRNVVAFDGNSTYKGKEYRNTFYQ